MNIEKLSVPPTHVHIQPLQCHTKQIHSSHSSYNNLHTCARNKQPSARQTYYCREQMHRKFLLNIGHSLPPHDICQSCKSKTTRLFYKSQGRCAQSTAQNSGQIRTTTKHGKLEIYPLNKSIKANLDCPLDCPVPTYSAMWSWKIWHKIESRYFFNIHFPAPCSQKANSHPICQPQWMKTLAGSI